MSNQPSSLAQLITLLCPDQFTRCFPVALEDGGWELRSHSADYPYYSILITPEMAEQLLGPDPVAAAESRRWVIDKAKELNRIMDWLEANWSDCEWRLKHSGPIIYVFNYSCLVVVLGGLARHHLLSPITIPSDLLEGSAWFQHRLSLVRQISGVVGPQTGATGASVEFNMRELAASLETLSCGWPMEVADDDI